MAGKSTLYISLRFDGDDKTLKAMSAASKELQASIRGVSAAASKAQGAGSRMQGLLTGITRQLGGMAAGFVSVSAAVGVLRDGLRTITDFERANSELAAVLGTTASGVSDLTREAQELGRKTEFTASQVTALQVSLARLGFVSSQIKDMQEPILQFAAAVGTDLGSAADFAGSALRGFGLKSEDTRHLLDVMARSTTASALSFEKLSVSMSIVAPVAHAFGLSAEDTVAFLGVLSNAGFDATSAATALRNILLNLADSNGKLAKGLGRTATTMPEIISALKELRDKGVDLNSTLEMTDKRSVAAFNSFIDGADSVQQLRDQLTDADGTLKEMYKTMTGNLDGAIKEVQSAWEGLMLSFRGAAGPLADMARGLANLINGLTDLSNWFSQHAGVMRALKEMREAIASPITAVTMAPAKLITARAQRRSQPAAPAAQPAGFGTFDASQSAIYGNAPAAPASGKASGKAVPEAEDESGTKAAKRAASVKTVASALKELNAEAQRAVTINQMFAGAASDESVRLGALESGLKSLIRQYGDGSEAVKDFYRSFARERGKLLQGGSITDGITPLKMPENRVTSGVGGLKRRQPVVDAGKTREATEAMTEQVSAVNSLWSSITQLTGAVDDSAAGWMTWIGNLASAVATAIPLILSLSAANKAQGTSAAFTAGAEAAKSVSGIPLVGPALAVAAVASVAAALLAMPKFAKGGLAYGPTLGMFGEYPGASHNPEVVAPLDRLRTLMQPSQPSVGEVQFRISGRDLVGVMNKRNDLIRRS